MCVTSHAGCFGAGGNISVAISPPGDRADPERGMQPGPYGDEDADHRAIHGSRIRPAFSGVRSDSH
jgi:hypothetical protein